MIVSPIRIKKSLKFSFGNSLLFGLLLFLVFLIMGYTRLWEETKNHIADLQKEKIQWQQTKKISPERSVTANIPKMSDLPNIIESCRNNFISHNVEVKSFNVERFAQEKGRAGKGLDYALVRLHLSGDWKGISEGINDIENRNDQAIHVQETVLTSDNGGDCLLQIYLLPDKELGT